MPKYEISEILFIHIRYLQFLIVFSLERKNMNSPGYYLNKNPGKKLHFLLHEEIKFTNSEVQNLSWLFLEFIKFNCDFDA